MQSQNNNYSGSISPTWTGNWDDVLSYSEYFCEITSNAECYVTVYQTNDTTTENYISNVYPLVKENQVISMVREIVCRYVKFEVKTTESTATLKISVIYKALGGGGGGGGSVYAVYGSFYDTTTQSGPGSTAAAAPMTINTTSESVDVSIQSGSRILVAKPGVYNIQFSAQLVKTKGGSFIVYIWLAKNGTPIADTNTSVTLEGGQGAAYVPSWNFVLSANAGDYFQLFWKTSENTGDIIMKTSNPLSGNGPQIPGLIVTIQQIANTVTGPTGPTGSSGDFFTLPPAFSFGTPYATSADIYIPINYPTQTYSGYFPQPLPTIESTILSVQYNNGSSNVTAAILNTGDIPFDKNYMNGLSTSQNSLSNHPLEGIIIHKSNSGNLPKPVPSSRLFYYNPTTSANVWSIEYNIASLGGSTGTNIILGTYTNYGLGSNTGSTGFAPYNAGVAPSNDARYISVIPNTNSTTQIILRISAPLSTGGTGVFIANYNTSYSTPGSLFRFLGQLAQLGLANTVTYTANPTPYSTPSTLYPDCTYSFNLTSTNTVGATSANCYSDPGLFTNSTSALTPLVTPINATTTVSGFVSNARMVSNGLTITNLLNNTAITPVVTPSAITVNYNETTRGSLGTGGTLLLLDAKLDSGSTASYGFASYPYLGAGGSTGSNVTLTYGTTVDQYSAYASQFQGFYTKLNTPGITVVKNFITPSNSTHSLTLVQTYYDASHTAVLGTYTSDSNVFYYDNVATIPTVTLSSFIVTAAPVSVSGIKIVGATTATFSITTNAETMGNFFYASPVFTYAFAGGVINSPTEATLANFTNGSFTDGSKIELTNSVQCINNSVSANVSGTFSTSTSLSVTAKNIVGNSSAVAATTAIQAVFDRPSYLLITTPIKYPASIQTTGVGVTSTGYRVWSNPGTAVYFATSGTTGATYLPPYYGLKNGLNVYSYSSIPYDNSWSITSTTTGITSPITTNIDTSQELQIFNGSYQSSTGPYSSGGVIGYTNYASYYQNTLNYSGVRTGPSNYRFATFVWNFPGSAGGPINNFNFVFRNMKVNGTNVTSNQISIDFNGSVYFDANGNTQRFFLNYRVEDTLSGTPIVVPTGSLTDITTIWVDGNSSFGTELVGGNPQFGATAINPAQFTSLNYNTTSQDPINLMRAPSARSYSVINTNDMQAQLSSLITDTTKSCYIYCRIGLPMISNYSFDYLTLSLS